LKAHKGDIAASLEKEEFFKERAGAEIGAADLTQVAITGTYKQDISLLDKTGLVIAGYGDDDFFPSCIVYECWGVVLGKFIFKETKRRAASHESVSRILPVAQSEMVNTFVNGISPRGFRLIGSMFRKALRDFEKAACEGEQDRTTLRNEAREKFLDALLDGLFQEHSIPLRRVVGSLSISELAELAETLITIESLKERVTQPTESVSGPVDVRLSQRVTASFGYAGSTISIRS